MQRKSLHLLFSNCEVIIFVVKEYRCFVPHLLELVQQFLVNFWSRLSLLALYLCLLQLLFQFSFCKCQILLKLKLWTQTQILSNFSVWKSSSSLLFRRFCSISQLLFRICWVVASACLRTFCFEVFILYLMRFFTCFRLILKQ